ncbi:hypothetical protein ACSLOE_30855, partial [Escherichia coli]
MSYHNDDVLLKFRKEWNVTPEEADWFISTNGQKVIYKKHQLRKIDMRPARILPSIERYEYDVV